ncbi:MAG: hypothetical protein M3464_14885 [Chloroflexota bacterium]|nr:hypothetical protein [Chloroflexota bacterium]
MSQRPIVAGQTAPGEYAPAGEAQGEHARFTADEVAAAFGAAIERVERAMAGELHLEADGRIDSRQAQRLAEALLTELPLAAREAALMRLGAFTPRPDHAGGFGEKAPGEESDRIDDEG